MGHGNGCLPLRTGVKRKPSTFPETDRGALCISSQVGCTLTCRFCHTGTQKLVRNLTPGEIVGQMLIARDHFNEWPSPKERRYISNVVFMGMGEPLYNYENVAQAIRILVDGEGIALSKRRITLSTAGVVPMIQRAGDELDVQTRDLVACDDG